jgi:tripartite ATP-independent transporter DctP family solute receptor
MKKTMRSMLFLVAFSMLFIALGVSDVKSEKASDGPKVKFTITSASVTAGSLHDLYCEEIVTKLSERTNGRIQGQKLPGGSLGGEREMGEALQLGTLDLAFLSDAGANALVGKMDWAMLPFIITDYETADDVYINGWINDELAKQMLEKGLVRVAPAENGFRELCNVTRPVSTVEDLKGLKIRVPDMPALVRFWELAGALPVALSTTEQATALQQGTIDGIDNGLYQHVTNGVADMLKYVTMTNHLYFASSGTASKIWWDSLTKEDQAIITEVVNEAGANYRKAVRAADQSLLDDQLKSGTWVLNEMSPELVEHLKKCGQQVLNEFEKNYDPAIIEKVKTEFGLN